VQYLNELSGVRHKAVTCYYSPTLIIAGAGSGKTHVINYRATQNQSMDSVINKKCLGRNSETIVSNKVHFLVLPLTLIDYSQQFE
jgi:chromosomal replication initiation ATPase DnaA